MALKKLNLQMRKGQTESIPLRISESTLVYKPITGIEKSAPVSITATGHGAKDGWLGAVMNVVGMREINAENNPPAEGEFRPMTVVDANTVQFNSVNAAGFRAYTSGGQLVYRAPLDLSAYSTGRMTIKDQVGGTAIISLTTANGRIEIDPSTHTLWIKLSDEDSSAITAERGVFDIELETSSGEVKAICSADSEVQFLPEVTT